MENGTSEHTHNHEVGFKEVCAACLGQVPGNAKGGKRGMRGVTFTTVLLFAAFGFTLFKQSHSSQSLWQSHYNAGHKALKANKFDEAKREFQLAVLESEHFKLTDHRRLSSMHKLADVSFYNLHDTTTALPMFEKLATTYQSILQHDDPELAEAYNDLAQAYAVSGNFAKSEEYYKKAVAVAEKTKPVEEHAKLSDILKNYADLLEKTDRHKEAQELIERRDAAPL